MLGYSGTNSKYVDIRDSQFFNNGAGVVPNTLDSERFEPNAQGKVRDNLIFWNNFNYYLPNSPVKTVSGGLGPGGYNYPTGIGVVLYGSTAGRPETRSSATSCGARPVSPTRSTRDTTR